MDTSTPTGPVESWHAQVEDFLRRYPDVTSAELATALRNWYLLTFSDGPYDPGMAAQLLQFRNRANAVVEPKDLNTLVDPLHALPASQRTQLLGDLGHQRVPHPRQESSSAGTPATSTAAKAA